MRNAGKLSLKYAAMAFALSFPFTAIAQEVQDDADTMATPAKQNSTVPLFSGGIGDDDMAYVKQEQHKYNTKILFTAAGGEYLSDLNVTIADRQGDNVVTTVTKGPVLLVDLPAGNYKLNAVQGGSTTRTLNIKVAGHGLHSYQVRFPVMAETAQ